MSDALRPVVLPPAGGTLLWVVDDLTTIKLGGPETGGAFALFETKVSPGKGTPPHVHSREDESFYVLEGELEFWVDGETVSAPAGTFLHAPRHVPHCFLNKTHEMARMIVMAAPAGMDAFFKAIGEPVTDPDGPPVPQDIARLEAGCAQFGITLLPPEVADEVE